MQYIRKISDYAIAGGLGALVVAGLAGCEQKPAEQAVFTEAAKKQGAFVVIEEGVDGSYKIADEYPSETTRIILRKANGEEKILTQEEIDALVKKEATKIDSNTSALTNPQMHSGGMSLGETILASAAGAIVGSWIGSKLFGSPGYQQTRQTSYKSPSAYSRSMDSFNKPKAAMGAGAGAAGGAKQSGFFGSKNTGSTPTPSAGSTGGSATPAGSGG